MSLDIPTLAITLSIVNLLQVIVLFSQYRMNKASSGLGWWALGTASLALGFAGNYLSNTSAGGPLAVSFNTALYVSGFALIYVGILKFLGRIVPGKRFITLFAVIALAAVYYSIFKTDAEDRLVFIAVAIAAISFLIARSLFRNKIEPITTPTKSLALIFLGHAVFLITLASTFFTKNLVGQVCPLSLLQIAFQVDILVISVLSTCGFILLVNQRVIAGMEEDKENLNLIFNTIPYAALITRLSDGLFIDVNERFLLISGYTRTEIVGSSTVQLNIWHILSDRQRFLQELNKNGTCENLEFVFRRKDGSQFVGMVSARIITIHDQPHIISVTCDITERQQVEEALRESEETYRSILNASPDDITIADLEGRILMVSPAASTMFGYNDPGEGIGLRVMDFITPEDHERARSNIMRMFQGGYPGPNEYRGVRMNGTIFDIEVNSGLIRSANRQPTKMVIIVRDITERKQAEQRIQQLVQQLEIEKNVAQLNAVTDSLTGLANRRCFDEAIKAEFYRLKRSGAPFSLIILDVDHFKKFNDFYGHLAGDNCLRLIGAALKTVVGRVPDVVARYGGEEFVAILPETEQNGAITLAERIRQAVEKLAIPHAASETADHVTVSLGVVTISSAADLVTPEQVVARADTALYSAKKGGRNRYVFFVENPGS